jgi:enediyne biosynthesis protein E4
MVPTAHAQQWQTGPGYHYLELSVPPDRQQVRRPDNPEKVGFQELPATKTGISFRNSLPEPLMLANGNFMNGSGVAAGDFDGDGLCDLYFCAIAGTNALYRNLGGWRFEDVTAQAGVGLASLHSTGAVFADIDGDGHLDLLVATLGHGVHSFINEGNGRFRETTGEAGLASESGSTSLALADVDGDGDLDLYVANYGAIPILRSGVRANLKRVDGQWVVTGPYANRLRVVGGKLEEQGEPDVLYLNDGHGRFKAVPWNSEFFLDEDGKPLAQPWDFGLSVQMRDMNGDGFPDIYVCNDFQSVDRFWVNDGHGKFRLVGRTALRKEPYSAMGVDFADIDRDGHLDFMVAEMLARGHSLRLRQHMAAPSVLPVPGQIENRPGYMQNMLFHNRGDGTYEEIANYSGVAASDWSWQPVFLDVDLDGYEDLLIVNGMRLNILDRDTLDRIRSLGRQPLEQLRTNTLLYPPSLTKKLAFRNRHDLRFEEVGARWGFDSPRLANGIALADLDNDGDLDIAINCLDDEPLIYRNETLAARILVRLQGQLPNRFGIGAKLQVLSKSLPPQSQEILCGGRYLSSDDAVRTFAASGPDDAMTVEVSWRSGKRSVVNGARPNRIYVIEEPFESVPNSSPASTFTTTRSNALPAAPMFKDVSGLLGHLHREEFFDDYVRQPLLHKQLSQLGPGIGWLDVDGDGQDELVLGTGKGGTLAVYRRNGTGKFERMPLTKEWTAPDDTAGLVAWASADGKRALLAAVAQYESPDPTRAAVFLCQADTNPEGLRISELSETRGLGSSAGPLAVADIDGDGDLDLFVGGRVIPGAYPTPARSRIFRQVSGMLSLDTTNSTLLDNIGLVSGAVWSDLTGDGFPELILACEWGPLRVFRNESGTLRPWDVPVVLPTEPGAAAGTTVPLSRLTGWWNGVTTGDFDGDGRLDIVASNWGLNDGYQATVEHPLSIVYGDIERGGLTDLIEAYFVPELGGDAPRRGLPTMAKAFSALAKNLPTHERFSMMTMDELLQVLHAALQKVESTTLASMIFLNRGSNFVAFPLAVEAQLAPAFSLNVGDVDGDGHEDLFLSQNFFAMRPEWPRLDGGRGLWLLGDGLGKLRPLPGMESGIAVYGEQRGAALGDFNQDGRLDLAVSQNGATTRLFENVGARPGLRVRLKGPPGNPWGIGAQIRLHSALGAGPVRELHAGSGYWSQDSLVTVMGCATYPERIEVRWPGGRSSTYPVPPGSLEIEMDASGGIKSTRGTDR